MLSVRRAVVVFGLLLWPTAPLAIPAFPGAEGFGTDTPGGRGGVVLRVNTTDDHDDGACDATDCTLREAIGVPGPRIVVFTTGGTIVLDPDLGALTITEPFITIAGQSSPGDGIQIRNDPVGSGVGAGADSFFSLVIDTNDVVIRYLRVRPGTILTNPDCIDAGMDHGLGNNTCRKATDIRAVSVEQNAYNVVLDHLSLSYAVDEMFNIAGSQDVTLSWSNVSEGLDYAVYDFLAAPNAFYGKGVVVGAGVAVAEVEPAGRASIHHNLMAHNSARGPLMNEHCMDTDATECYSDSVNNVLYNWNLWGNINQNRLGHAYTNVIGNFFRTGPSTPAGSIADRGLRINDWNDDPNAVIPFADLEVHQAAPPFHSLRYVSDTENEAMPVTCVVRVFDAEQNTWTNVACNPATYDVPKHPTAEITTTTAEVAWNEVPEEAGSIRTLAEDGTWVFFRDANDQRVLDDVRAGTGSVIESEAEWQNRGYATLAAGTPYADSDLDGMPDVWEGLQCLDEFSPDDSGDADGDGYTNVEEYLNGTAATDTDGDTFLDHEDNCSAVDTSGLSGPVQQADDDSDGFGDACDCDYSGDGDCDGQDQAKFSWCLSKQRFPDCNWADVDGDSDVDAADQAFFDASFAAGVPGPGAATCTL